MQLKNRVVFITGGARGIGAACAKLLVEKGAKVVIADINEQNGRCLAKDLNTDFGDGSALFVQCDVTDHTQFKDAFQSVVTTFKSVDVMVNNAGIGNETNWEEMLNINLKGTISGTELALAHMRKDKGGKGGVIINVASVLGFQPLCAAPVYVASKHGVIGFTRSMATAPDIIAQGVRYACVCPDMVDTPIFHNYKPTLCREGYYDDIMAAISQEMLSPDTVAEGLLSLIADDDSNDSLLHISLKDGLVRKKITVENV